MRMRSPYLSCATTLFLVLLGWGAHAEELRLSPEHITADFAQQVSYVLEPASGLSPAEAIEALLDAPTFASTTINLGYLEHPVWLAVTVTNTSDTAQRWVLMTLRASLQVLEIYEAERGVPLPLFDYSDEAQRRHAFEEYFGLAAPVDIGPNASKRILIRFKATASNWLPMEFVPSTKVAHALFSKLATALITATLVLTLIFLNAISAWSTREPVYVWYCLAMLTSLLVAAHLRGATTAFWFNGDPAAGQIFGSVMASLAAALMTLFSARFFHRRLWQRGDDYWATAHSLVITANLTAAGGLLAAAAAGFDVSNLLLTGWFIALPTYAFIAIHAGTQSHQRDAAATLLAVVWSIYFLLLLMMALTSAGLMQPFGPHWLSVGPFLVVEGTVMAIALNLRVRQATLAETALREERALAVQEMQDNANLVLSIGHDSRNIVRGLELLSQRATESSSAEQMRVTATEIKSLATTLGDTLSVLIAESRSTSVEMGGRAYEMVKVETVFHTMELLFKRQAAKANRSLSFRFQGDSLAADRAVLTRLLMNLIDNAIKYGAGDRILVTYRTRATGHEFRVWNSGGNLSQATLDTLVDPNLRTTRHQPGVKGEGVGLKTCIDLLDQEQGNLFARGEVGQASCFGFTLPYPDVDNLRNWQVIVTGSLAVAPTLPDLLNTMMPDRLNDRAYDHRTRRKRLKLFAVPAEPAPLPKSQTGTALIAVTNDRSREFRSAWQDVADALLYLPFTPESLVAAMNGAARSQK